MDAQVGAAWRPGVLEGEPSCRRDRATPATPARGARRVRRSALRWGAVLAASLLCAVPSAPRAAAACEAWPGEPALASPGDVDPLLARWSALRIADLEALAAALEPVAPARAHRVWVHITCLDPSDARAREGMARTRPVRIHRPEVVEVVVDRVRLEPVSLDDVGERVRVARVPPPEPQVARVPPPEPQVARVPPREPQVARVPPAREPRAEPPPPEAPAPPDWSGADALLEQAEREIRSARFEAALGTARTARGEVAEAGDVAGASERIARAEVAAATAEVALGRAEAARESFARALRADPDLELDPMRTSPKVRRVFDAARGATP